MTFDLTFFVGRQLREAEDGLPLDTPESPLAVVPGVDLRALFTDVGLAASEVPTEEEIFLASI